MTIPRDKHGHQQDWVWPIEPKRFRRHPRTPAQMAKLLRSLGLTVGGEDWTAVDDFKRRFDRARRLLLHWWMRGIEDSCLPQCRQCLALVPKVRRVYVTPLCYACLPPPDSIAVLELRLTTRLGE